MRPGSAAETAALVANLGPIVAEAIEYESGEGLAAWVARSIAPDPDHWGERVACRLVLLAERLAGDRTSEAGLAALARGLRAVAPAAGALLPPLADAVDRLAALRAAEDRDARHRAASKSRPRS